MSVVEIDPEDEWKIKENLAKERGKRKRGKTKALALRQKHRKEQVFEYMLQGRTNKWISQELDVSVETVRKDMKGIYKYYKENPAELDVLRRVTLDRLDYDRGKMIEHYCYISATNPGSNEAIKQMDTVARMDLEIYKSTVPKEAIVAYTTIPDMFKSISVVIPPRKEIDVSYSIIATPDDDSYSPYEPSTEDSEDLGEDAEEEYEEGQ